MNDDALARLADRCGFTHRALLDISTIDLKPEVRGMCAENTCGLYGRRWSCPPGCGTLRECEERLRGFSRGILVQTVGEVEDSFDFEGMARIEQVHKESFDAMYAALRADGVRTLALGAGGCTRCQRCTYPDAPCRFPESMVSSMEAYGMLVLEVCRANGLKYYYGPGALAFTGCFLV